MTPSGTAADLWDVAFTDRMNGWAVGVLATGEETGSPIILATTDGGARWHAQTVPAGVDSLKAVQFIDDETGWAIGTPGVVLRTTDGGSTWKRSRLAPQANPLDLDFVDGKYGWVCGTIGLGGNFGYHTVNGGLTWTRESIPGDVSSAVDFIDRKHGYRVGDSGLVAATSDGGKTWNFLPTSAPSSYLFDVRMWGDGTGYVVGQFGTIMKTVTGGEGPK